MEGHNKEAFGMLVDKKYLVDMLENSSKFKEFERTAVTRDSCSMGSNEHAAIALLLPGPAERGTSRTFPGRYDPDFGEVFVLAIVAVVFREHFPQLLREFIGLDGGMGVLLAGLVVANAKSRTTAIAELERLDRIGRIFLDFLVENRHWAVQIVCHVILRWVEDCLAQLVVSFRVGLQVEPEPLAQRVTGRSRNRVSDFPKFIAKLQSGTCGIRADL
jgi:hypothetical protein